MLRFAYGDAVGDKGKIAVCHGHGIGGHGEGIGAALPGQVHRAGLSIQRISDAGHPRIALLQREGDCTALRREVVRGGHMCRTVGHRAGIGAVYQFYIFKIG